MSHSLHRVGTRESLEKDWVVLAMPAGNFNHVGSAPKLKRFFEICVENGCSTLGDARSGNEFYQGSRQAVIDNVEDRACITATFNTEKEVQAVLKQLKEEDLGISVVVSGLIDRVTECCHRNRMEPHTVLTSLGRWGRTEKLPPYELMEIATMCGHSLVALPFLREMIEKVKTGKCTAEKAADILFEPCMCGIFNKVRAARLIKEYLEKEKSESAT